MSAAIAASLWSRKVVAFAALLAAVKLIRSNRLKSSKKLCAFGEIYNEKPQKDATNYPHFGLTLLGCPLLLTCHITLYIRLVNAIVAGFLFLFVL